MEPRKIGNLNEIWKTNKNDKPQMNKFNPRPNVKVNQLKIGEYSKLDDEIEEEQSMNDDGEGGNWKP